MNSDFPFGHFLKLKNSDKNITTEEKAEPADDFCDVNNESSFYEAPAPFQTKKAKNSESSFSVEELNTINQEILSIVKDFINEQKYNTFFKNTFSLINISENTISFAVTTNFIKIMIETHYLSFIKQAIESVLGNQYTLSLNVANSQKSLSSNVNNILNTINESKAETFSDEVISQNKSIKNVKSARFKPTGLNLFSSKKDLEYKIESKVINHVKGNKNIVGKNIDPKKTFDSFIEGPSNNMAYASSIAVSNNPGKTYPCLYIHSSSGLGKTHLLHSIANGIREKYPAEKICLITGRGFMNEMVDAMSNKRIGVFRKKYSEHVDVLIIDDIHEIKNKQGTQNEFFHVFNELYNKGKQLIFTSDTQPNEIIGIEDRIRTRLAWGLVLDIQKPNLETRIAILKRKAIEEDIYIPDDVITMIASSIEANIRELEGALIRLGAYSSVFNVDIDTEIAKEQLKISNFNSKKTYLDIKTIAGHVSSFYKISVADLKSKSRMKEITTARHVAMYLSYKVGKATLSEIGTFFGNRDHSTVLHGVEKIKKINQTDSMFAQLIIDLESTILGSNQ